MKKWSMFFALIVMANFFAACGGDECEDGSEPDEDGDCPAGDDDAT